MPLARIDPWPTVSGLVGYDGRIWLVNGVKFPDHNSADVYSYDPRSGRGRVPPEMLARAFGGKPHRGEKYADVAPAAASAVAEIGQRDVQTLNALVARLEIIVLEIIVLFSKN